LKHSCHYGESAVFVANTVVTLCIHTVVSAQTACQVRQIHDHSVLYSAANVNNIWQKQKEIHNIHQYHFLFKIHYLFAPFSMLVGLHAQLTSLPLHIKTKQHFRIHHCFQWHKRLMI